MAFVFKCASLPRPIYMLLKQITKAEKVTQREAMCAGLLALTRLPPEQLQEVWATAKHECRQKRRDEPGPDTDV